MENFKKIKTQDGVNTYELGFVPEVVLPTFFSYKERKVTKKDATAEYPAGTKKKVAFNYSLNAYVDVADVAGDGFVELGKRTSAEVVTVRYVKELDCLMIEKGLYATTIKCPEKGRYQTVARVYITRDKKVFTCGTAEQWRWICVDGDYKSFFIPENPDLVYDFKNNLSEFTNSSAIVVTSREQLLEACKSLWGAEVVPVEGNRSVTLDRFYNIVAYVNHKSRIKRNGPKQRAIDELTSIALPEISGDDCKAFREVYGHKYSVRVGHICRVNDDKCVVRIFNNGYETTRFYVDKKTVNACNRADDGTWLARPFTAKSGSYDWTFRIDSVDAEAVAGTQLEYLIDMIEGIEANDRGLAVWALLSMPYLERVMKYDERLKAVISNALTSYDPINDIERQLGTMKDAKKINAVLGFNKFQLDFFASREFKGLQVLKEVFGDTFIDFDNDTTVFLASLVDVISTKRRTNDIMCNLKVVAEHYGWPTMKAVGKLLIELAKKDDGIYNCILNRHRLDGCSTFALYTDYLNMVVEMGCNLPVNIPLNSVRSAHDMAVELYNLHEVEVEKEKWDKRIRSWNKWTFAPEEEDYLVVAPREPQDLAREGITLSHCVKNYIGRVTNGTTNIMFIRKKDEPDVPFFTVEVGNGGTVEQIHGFANRNLCTEPALVPFVKKWVKACKLKSNNFNKVR